MAEYQLSKERGEVRLTSVQARLCQCFYLLSLSRINHCWSLFGTTAHLALAIGLNRNRRADPAGSFTQVEIECRRRVFWCAYSLDNYLSAALGRPRTFHDADIDAELPVYIEDSQLSASSAPPSSSCRRQSSMLAPVAHVRLSRIVSVILRDLYPIKSLSMSLRSSMTAKCSQDLRDWRAEMASFLDLDGVDITLLLPLYQRQRTVLNLAYWHAVILTHRPFLLSNFAQLQQNGNERRPSSHRAQTEASVGECLNAAMEIVGTVDELVESGQMYRAFWVSICPNIRNFSAIFSQAESTLADDSIKFTSYFAFCAVVVLYVYCIQESASMASKYSTYLDAARKCQTQIAGLADQESLAQRYCLVLEELRSEAVRRKESTQTVQALVSQHPVSERIIPATAQEAALGAGYEGGVADLQPSPSSSLADVTSWGNFDSLVSHLRSISKKMTNKLSGHIRFW